MNIIYQRLRKSIAFIALLGVVAGCSSLITVLQADIDDLPSGIYTLDKSHASLVWRVNHIGLSNYTARFTDFNASINLDTQNIANSIVTANIDPLSIQTDYPTTKEKDFNKILAEESEWLNGLKFPNITFESTKIIITDENNAVIKGDLKILDTVKSIELDVKYNGSYKEHPFTKKPAIGFSATSTIFRSNWGITKYIPMIGDSVDIVIEVEFYKE